MEDHLSPEAEARAVFSSIDANSDGLLDASELCGALSDSGTTDYELEQLFFALDTNHDNMISMDEFVAGFQKYRRRARPPQMRAVLLSELLAFRDKHRDWIETASFNEYTKTTQMPTMYEVVPELIKPATQLRQCSFSELGPAHAVDYFVSHVSTPLPC